MEGKGRAREGRAGRGGERKGVRFFLSADLATLVFRHTNSAAFWQQISVSAQVSSFHIH